MKNGGKNKSVAFIILFSIYILLISLSPIETQRILEKRTCASMALAGRFRMVRRKKCLPASIARYHDNCVRIHV